MSDRNSSSYNCGQDKDWRKRLIIIGNVMTNENEYWDEIIPGYTFIGVPFVQTDSALHYSNKSI
jgi:hypothetical protein